MVAARLSVVEKMERRNSKSKSSIKKGQEPRKKREESRLSTQKTKILLGACRAVYYTTLDNL